LPPLRGVNGSVDGFEGIMTMSTYEK